MNVIATPRDYGLLGRDAKIAEEMGLASAQWYQCPLPRKRLKELMQRKDGPAIRDTLIWFASFLISGGLAYFFWPNWHPGQEGHSHAASQSHSWENSETCMFP